MTTALTCPRCGEALSPGARYCTRCGNDVSGEQARAATVNMTAAVAPDPQADLLRRLREATIGEFEIYEELGRGGMATVYLAHEIALGRKVAIKVMNQSLVGTGAQMVERFKREARTAAALSHPHIIPIYAVRESPFIFFVMKFVKGRSLDSIIKNSGALPIPMIQAILHQAGGAIDYGHRQGIVHRDIKPANIMLDEDGWAVVTDFGIAKVADAQHLTMTGVTVGTPSYMSPEQCAAKEVTAASDQYSLGIVAYEMLTAQVPFHADTVMGVMWQHFNDPPRPIRELRPDCPTEIEHAVLRMLAKKAEDRFPTVEEAIDAIGTLVLRRDDPIRQQMKALARQGPGAEALGRVHTPQSPIPTGTAPPASTPTPAPPTGTPAPPARPATPPAVTPVPAPPAPGVSDAPTVLSDPSIADAPTKITPVPPQARTETPTVMAPPPTPTPPTIQAPPPATPAPTTPAPRAPAPPPAPPAAAEPPRRPPPPKPKRSAVPVMLGAVVVALLGAGAWYFLGRGIGPGGPGGIEDSLATPLLPVATVGVTPSPVSIPVGGTLPLTAVLADSAGNALTDREVTWQVTDTTVVRITAQGVVTARAAGRTTITATSEGRSGQGAILVTATATPIATMAVAPDPASVALGDSLSLVAAPRDAAGNTLGGRSITWSSSAPAVASVTPGGVLAGLREGTATITATAEGKRASVRVTVTPPAVAAVQVTPGELTLIEGGTAQVSAAARDRRGGTLSGRAVQWSSSDERVATVAANGAVRAVGTGRATITARIEGVTGAASVAVGAVPVASVAVAAPPALSVGGTTQLQATTRDERGRSLDRPVTWSSSNSAVASVSSTGQVSAAGPGTATITATSEGRSAQVTVTVTAPATPVAGPVGGGEQPGPVVTPPAAAAAALPRRAIAAGGQHSCGVTAAGTVACWGSNSALQLGDAGAGQMQAQAAVLGAPRGATRLVAGGGHTCALLDGGEAVCWGQNRNGQLGGTGAQPVSVGGGHSFVALSAGARHTCGIAGDGLAWCWGDNGTGQLGDGSTRGGAAPRQVRGGLKFRAIAAGSDHTCGVTQAGQVHCWGDGFSGQLGRGIRESQTEPVEVQLPTRASGIVAGAKHACALGQNGTAYCWGENRAGEVGDGSRSERASPVAVSGRVQFAALAAGASHTCGITESGEAYCWGDNRQGQLGDGSRNGRQQPTKVAGAPPLRDIAAGDAHTCALTRSQEALCWGGNARGQIGDGTTEMRAAPTAVTAGP